MRNINEKLNETNLEVAEKLFIYDYNLNMQKINTVISAIKKLSQASGKIKIIVEPELKKIEEIENKSKEIQKAIHMI